MSKLFIEISLFLVVLIWAGNQTIGKISMRELDPLIYSVLRFSIATPVMFAMLWRRGEEMRVSGGDFVPLLVLGIVGVAVYQTVFIAALKYTTVTVVALMLGASPVFTSLLGAVTGQEKLSANFLVGCLIAFAGLYLVISFGAGNAGPGISFAYGDAIALAAGFLWGLYPILLKPLVKKHSVIWVNAYSFFVGAVALWLYCWPELTVLDWRAVSPFGWFAVFYGAIPSTVLALVVWSYGIEKIGSNQTMIYMYMIPPASMLIAAATIGESVGLVQVAGAAITLFGVYLVKRQSGPVISYRQE